MCHRNLITDQVFRLFGCNWKWKKAAGWRWTDMVSSVCALCTYRERKSLISSDVEIIDLFSSSGCVQLMHASDSRKMATADNESTEILEEIFRITLCIRRASIHLITCETSCDEENCHSLAWAWVLIVVVICYE